jgi:hypothetical protein
MEYSRAKLKSSGIKASLPIFARPSESRFHKTAMNKFSTLISFTADVHGPILESSLSSITSLISGGSFSAVPVKYEHFIRINPTSSY